MNEIERLTNNLYHPDLHTRERDGENELRKHGAAALGTLVAVLSRQYSPPTFPPPKRVTGLLRPFVSTPDPREIEKDARCRAAHLLGHIQEARAAEALLTATRDEEAEVRYHAALALGDLKDAQAVEPLCAALQSPDYVIRAAAASRLGELGDPRAVEPLVRVLQQDGRTLPRWRATHALGQLGDARAVQPLVNSLLDLLGLPASEWAPPNRDELYEDSLQVTWTTCGYLLEALTLIGDPQAAPSLEEFARRVPSQTIAEKARKCAVKIQQRQAA